MSRRLLRKLIKDTGGIVSQMATDAGVSRQTIYNLLDKYGEWNLLAQVRSDIVLLWQCDIYDAVKDTDIEIGKWRLFDE